MKSSAAGLLKMKPFDESGDVKLSGQVYANSLMLTTGIIGSTGLVIVACLMALVGAKQALGVLGLAVGVSAIVAGLEWHAGLKVRALNQLFGTLVASVVIALVR